MILYFDAVDVQPGQVRNDIDISAIKLMFKPCGALLKFLNFSLT